MDCPSKKAPHLASSSSCESGAASDRSTKHREGRDHRAGGRCHPDPERVRNLDSQVFRAVFAVGQLYVFHAGDRITSGRIQKDPAALSQPPGGATRGLGVPGYPPDCGPLFERHQHPFRLPPSTAQSCSVRVACWRFASDQLAMARRNTTPEPYHVRPDTKRPRATGSRPPRRGRPSSRGLSVRDSNPPSPFSPTVAGNFTSSGPGALPGILRPRCKPIAARLVPTRRVPSGPKTYHIRPDKSPCLLKTP